MLRPVLTAALVTSSLTFGGALAAISVPASAEGHSPIELRAPDEVVVRSDRGWVHSDFGVRVVARGEHFLVHAIRPQDYDGPIEAVWKRESGDVALGEMDSWQGLDRFSYVEVFQGGERVRHRVSDACFNGRSRKVGPGSPAGPSNPFPLGCPWNPYTLGSVMGVAQDHAVPLLSFWNNRMRLEPGRYRVVAGITRPWREKLQISAADATVTTTLVVEKRTAATSDPTAPAHRPGTDDLEATAAAPTDGSAGAMSSEYAPDLRSLPAFDIGLNGTGTALSFGATVWNGGAGPLVIEGFRDGEDHMTAYQYYFDELGNQTGYDQVGHFDYHAGNHQHWHFRDFARYSLFRPDESDPELPGEIAVRSTKASFCLVATDAVDLTVPHADMRPEHTDLGSQCGGSGAQMLRQVLANGHGDTYHQFRAGQAFRVGTLPDGDYFLSVEANPADDATAENGGRNLQELDYANNDSYRRIRLWTTPGGVRKVRAYQVGVIEELSFGDFRMR